jgi:hypothetical protein
LIITSFSPAGRRKTVRQGFKTSKTKVKASLAGFWTGYSVSLNTGEEYIHATPIAQMGPLLSWNQIPAGI